MPQPAQEELKVMRSLFIGGRTTRAVLAKGTRLSPPRVSSILERLEKRGYVQRAGKATNQRGRPSYLFQIHPEMGYTLGVAVGVDHFRVVVMNGAKEIMAKREFPLTLPTGVTPPAQAIVDQLSTQISRAMKRDFAKLRPIVALGVALPGLVDTSAGTWLLGLWLPGIARVPVVSQLRERLGLPVSIEDIARSVAVREMHHGFGRQMRNFVLLYLGAGVGSGVVMNHEIYRGFHGMAGEIGHVEHPDNTYRCVCTNVGCFETIISTTGIQRVIRDRLAEGVTSSLKFEGQDPSLDQVLEAARAGDRFAQSTLQEIGGYLGDACAILVKMFNPEGLIVSGRAAMFRDYFAEPVNQVIRRRVLPEMLEGFTTTFADHDPYHEAHGAALVAMGHYLDWRSRRKESPAVASAG
jgi:predicted NBD/HSP70 family sugar kinase